MRSDQTGIFCLEGDWNSDLTDRTSIEPQLRMLENMGSCGGVIHRDVATREEFCHYLRRWLQKQYAAYSIGYLAFHGNHNAIVVGRDTLTLADIAAEMRGKAVGRILYFGACQTMATEDAELQDFCATSGAKAIVGYTKSIDWLESAAFDLILLPQLMTSRYAKPVFARLSNDHRRFVTGLGLRIATANWASPRRIAAAAAG